MLESTMLKGWFYADKLNNYMIPIDPAVKPTARKKTNSSKSLGKELTINLKWVI